MVEEQVETLQKIINTAVEFLVNYSFQVLGAIVVLVVGFIIAGWIAGLLFKIFQKKNIDVTLAGFLAGIVKALVIAFAVIIALGKFGITIAPFIAALGALAFGASLAIQGPLANYGAGVTIILTRPFVVGNTITVQDVNGIVQEVKLACTILTNEDGVQITIPNKKILGEILHNSQENRIVHGVIGISYGDDPEKAVRTVRETLGRFADVVKQPQPQVGVQEFADSSVNIGFRYWVPTVKYFSTSYEVNLAVYNAIKQAGITIPFPQRDLHIVSQPSNASSQVGANQS